MKSASPPSGSRHRPGALLVTGVPRSGTTWLARWLAHSPGLALTGREPMNPRGRQYALAGTLPGWARVTEPTARQRRALVLAYRGLNPWVYSRYGLHQWAAPRPSTRLVVKDPFALLSTPMITRHTGAIPVLVYRHPGAILASYRRMGWTPDLDELGPIVEAVRAEGATGLPNIPPEGSLPPAEAMGVFWAALHEIALRDLETVPDHVVVSHEELASSGPRAGRRLAERLSLEWSQGMQTELSRESASVASDSRLHNFDRAPADVAEAWRGRLAAEEVQTIESTTAETRRKMDSGRFVLS